MKHYNSTLADPDIEEEIDEETSIKLPWHLTIFNDDVNTFEHVINTLVEILNHNHLQAEQCAMIVHYKGKCSVKTGSFTDLIPYRDAITDRGIDARVLES